MARASRSSQKGGSPCGGRPVIPRMQSLVLLGFLKQEPHELPRLFDTPTCRNKDSSTQRALKTTAESSVAG